MPTPSAAFKKFHSLAGHERRHFHGRSSDLRRMMNVSGQNDWKMVKHIRKVVSDGGLESLATFKNAGGQQEQDQNPFSRSFHSLGRTLFLSLAESGKSIPVDFCLSLLDQIIKQGINHNNNSIEHIIQACSEFLIPKPTHFRMTLIFANSEHKKVLTMATVESFATNIWCGIPRTSSTNRFHRSPNTNVTKRNF